MLAHLRPRARAVYSSGRFTSVEGNAVTFALPNAAHVEHAMPLRDEVADTLSDHFATRLVLRLVADADVPATAGAGRRGPEAFAGPSSPEDEPELDDVLPSEDVRAPREEGVSPSSASWAESRLLEEFPGAEEVS